MLSKKAFRGRRFTTFLVVISFLVMTISGLVLYITPPGRVAHWTNWKFLGITKEGWGAMHTIFSLLFMIIAILHLRYNWRVFLIYIRDKVKQSIRLRWEFLAAVLVSVIIFVGTLYNMPPFATIMGFGERIKHRWEETQSSPPIPHAELLSLEAFASQIEITLSSAVEKLTSKGYKIEEPKKTLKEIASENKISAQHLYEIITGDSHQNSGREYGGREFGVRGFGRQTLKDVCSEIGIPLNVGISRLKEEGIDAAENETMRDIASKYQLSPADLWDMLANGGIADE